MAVLKHDLLTSKYTKVQHEDFEDMKYNAPHHFVVSGVENQRTLSVIHFQEGAIKECGVNGVCNEDLIGMVITRLEHFQKTPYNCRENDMTITKLEEALMWLRKRTTGRENRQVEGTGVV